MIKLLTHFSDLAFFHIIFTLIRLAYGFPTMNPGQFRAEMTIVRRFAFFVAICHSLMMSPQDFVCVSTIVVLGSFLVGA